MVAHLSDEDLVNLPRGGHDYRKLYAAYKAATENLGAGAPTAILCKTIKGWTLGPDIEGRNATHQIKKMTRSSCWCCATACTCTTRSPSRRSTATFRRTSAQRKTRIEYQYMMERRKALGGSIPKRRGTRPQAAGAPRRRARSPSCSPGSGTQAVSTTMGFTRLLRGLARDEKFGHRVVPIIPDEARTFGMDSLFRELKIYASQGQKYEPVDHEMLLSYAEAANGQILEEGITEAGSTASFIAAGTAYATRGIPVVPFYTFYSMFGFQRVGDLIWQAADARTRGFLLGATAGRTTLMGEGLQHQDGHSLVHASTVPPCQAYDPAFAYEVAAIVQDGLQRMYGANGGEDPDVFYYITLYNENYTMPAMPEGDPAELRAAIMRGLYRWSPAPEGPPTRATLLFSGSAPRRGTRGRGRARRALRRRRRAVVGDFVQVAARGRARGRALEPAAPQPASRGSPQVAELLGEAPGPIVAVTDFMKIVPEQIARFLPGRTVRAARHRRHGSHRHPRITAPLLRDRSRPRGGRRALGAHAAGEVDADQIEAAIKRYDVDPEAVDPYLV